MTSDVIEVKSARTGYRLGVLLFVLIAAVLVAGALFAHGGDGVGGIEKYSLTYQGHTFPLYVTGGHAYLLVGAAVVDVTDAVVPENVTVDTVVCWSNGIGTMATGSSGCSVAAAVAACHAMAAAQASAQGYAGAVPVPCK